MRTRTRMVAAISRLRGRDEGGRALGQGLKGEEVDSSFGETHDAARRRQHRPPRCAGCHPPSLPSQQPVPLSAKEISTPKLRGSISSRARARPGRRRNRIFIHSRSAPRPRELFEGDESNVNRILNSPRSVAPKRRGRGREVRSARRAVSERWAP